MNISFETLIPWFIVLLVIPTALATLGLFGYGYLESRHMDNWEATWGVITKSNAKIAGASFLPDFEYTYIVAGVEHTGRALTMWPRITYDRQVAEGWIKQYPLGKQITVFYNPKRPRVAVLERSLF